MSGRVPHRDRLRRKPTVELDEVLGSLHGTGEARRLRSSSYSPVRAGTSPQETKIARDFSVVTLETEEFQSQGEQQASNLSQETRNGKLSDELFSWRRHAAQVGNGAVADDKLTTGSSGISEDLLSISSDQSGASFLSSEGRSKPQSTRHPASQRITFGSSGKPSDEIDSLRNESIAVGVGLLLLFFFTYIVQYCARHGYIKIPEHEDVLATSHDEL